MKKISSLLLVCLSLLFFASCNKSSGGGSNYYIKANIDGTEKTYTTNPLVVSINQNSYYSLAVSAGSANSSSEGISLQITQNSGAITSGTYIDGTAGASYTLGGDYNPGTTDIAKIYGAGLQLSTTAPLTITITQLTNSQVSGTFSGEFFDNSG